MATVSLQQAQASLADLVHGLAASGEVVITENDRPVARIVAAAPARERKLGTLKGTVLNLSPDFDAPLEDFGDYTK